MSRTGLLGHIKTYHENYEYPCIQCGKVFMSISGLTTHKMTKHSLNKEPLYSCGKCEFKGWLKGDLTRHLTRVHGGLKTKECYFCDKKYYSFYLLVQHCRRHTLECEVWNYLCFGRLSFCREWNMCELFLFECSTYHAYLDIFDSEINIRNVTYALYFQVRCCVNYTNVGSKSAVHIYVCTYSM